MYGKIAAGALTALVVGATADSLTKGRLLVSASNTKPTCATAASAGEFCADGDIETNGALDVAGASTLTGAVSAGSTLGVTGLTTPTGGIMPGVNAVTSTKTFSSADCGEITTASAAATTFTLPEASTVLGCEITISYIGADAGAQIDITPLDADADGIDGGCTLAASVVTFSGTADADIGLTTGTSLTGDFIKLRACSATQWCVTGCQGIWANN